MRGLLNKLVSCSLSVAGKWQHQQLRRLNIHEYQGAELMGKYGVNVPKGVAVSSLDEVKKAIQDVFPGESELVVKSQVLAGGRGLGKFKNGFQGGVHIVKADKIEETAGKMLGQILVTKQTGSQGKIVSKVYLCEKLSLVNEMYFAIMLDRTSAGPLIIACKKGGTSIEDLAEKFPDLIIKVPIDVFKGITDEDAAKVVDGLAPKVADRSNSIERKRKKTHPKQKRVNTEDPPFCFSLQMIQNFDQTVRRILTFPAVHPCEAISPATLLNSLINLSQNICNYQSNLFATQRKNARQTIRQIGLLLLFFEETRDRRLALSDSVVLCFSELHLAFQKVQFLLEDCTREGAKLWILVKFQIVSTQFRALIRAIATALDVLPLSLIDVGGEVKELVELVGKQARNAKVEVDPEDEWALKQVFSILDNFEMGTEPDSSFMKRVLDHLEIRNWNDCNKEIKFLEEQIGFQCSDCNEREVPFLSSLLGLMSYCRGVIFETWNHRNNDRSDARHGIEAPSCLHTEDFRCPISLELMTDPVTVSTGQTYDRSSIQRWLKAGNMTCPKTGERLTSTELVPNTTLRKLIQQCCTDVGICASNSGSQSRDIARTISPGSPAAAEEMKFLSRFLARRLVFGSREQKTKAAYEIRLLAKSNIFNRSCLIEAGTVLPLINLLSSSFEHHAQEIAISALLKLSKHACGKKEIIESGGLQPILAVLQRGLSLEAKQLAAATIFYLASVKAYRKLIGETPEVVPTLVELIKDGTTCGKKNGVVAIFGLLLHSGNHQRVLASGTIPLLMDILSSSDNDELIADSVAVLAAMAESIDGTLAILQTSALSTIPRILQSSPSRAAREYCVTVLLSLCKNGGAEAIAILAKDHSLMSSLYSLLSDGTPHGSSKARALIKTLHKFHETSSSGRIASAVPCERPVHVW